MENGSVSYATRSTETRRPPRKTLALLISRMEMRVLLAFVPLLVLLGQGSFGDELADVTSSISDTGTVLFQLGRHGLGNSAGSRRGSIGPQISISTDDSSAAPTDEQAKDMEGALKQDVAASKAKESAARGELEEMAKEQSKLKAQEQIQLRAEEQRLAKKKKADDKAVLGTLAGKPSTVPKLSSSGLEQTALHMHRSQCLCAQRL